MEQADIIQRTLSKEKIRAKYNLIFFSVNLDIIVVIIMLSIRIGYVYSYL